MKEAYQKAYDGLNTGESRMRIMVPQVSAYSVDGLLDFIEFCKLKEGMKMAELGSFKGESTVLFGASGAEVHSVDLWKVSKEEEPLYRNFKMKDVEKMYDKNIKNYKNIKKVKSDTVSAAAQYPDEYFDVIYIDANHTYDGVCADIEAWWPKLKKNGIMGGHDYFAATPENPTHGVMPAVQNILRRPPVATFKDTSWALFKDLTAHMVPRQKFIHMILQDEGGCGYYRHLLPHNKLIEVYYDKYIMNYDVNRINYNAIKAADFIVIARGMDTNLFFTVINNMKPGAKLIWDGDDDYMSIDDKNPAYEKFNDKKYFIKEGVQIYLANANVVTASTEYLANTYRNYTKAPVKVLPNCIDVNIWTRWYSMRKEMKKKDDGFVRFGWAGGDSHNRDIKSILNVLLWAFKTYPTFKLVVAGWNFTESCEFNDYQDRIEYHTWVSDPKGFGKLLTSFDVGLCPLQIGMEFNKGKSSNKYMEYSLMGIPTIASNELPYQLIKQGQSGILCNNEEEWKKAIEFMMTNPGAREVMGEAARKQCIETFDIDTNVQRWDKFYSEL